VATKLAESPRPSRRRPASCRVPVRSRLTGKVRPARPMARSTANKPKKPSDDGRVADDRQRLGRTFDSAADLYQQARPEYPGPLYDTLVEVAGIGTGDRLLEIGCATGKATLPLARRGFRITCVEIGPDLAVLARGNLAAFPFVEVIGGLLTFPWVAGR